MGRAVFTTGLFPFAQNTVYDRLTRKSEPFRQATLIRVGVKLYDGHRRGGRQIMRIDCLQKRLCETREFGVQLQLYPCGQKREALQQSLYIRVGALEFVQR